MPNEIQLYGVIGSEGLTAADIKSQLAEFDQSEELIVRFDTPGGSVFAGLAMFKAFESYPGPKRAVIESAAFSIGSYLAMAFDEIEITDNGYLMIHNPMMASEGDDEAHARDAKLLGELKADMIRAYSTRTGIAADKIEAMMKAETYISAADALAEGFVSRVLAKSAVSLVVESHQKQLPFKVCASLRSDKPDGVTPTETEPVSDQNPAAATITEIEAAYPHAESKFVLSCIKRQLPMAEVAAEMNTQLSAQNDDLVAANEQLTAKVAELEAKIAEAKPAPGTQPVGTGTQEPTASAKDRWSAAVAAELKTVGDRGKAVQAANRKHPGLRAEMLAEVNA